MKEIGAARSRTAAYRARVRREMTLRVVRRRESNEEFATRRVNVSCGRMLVADWPLNQRCTRDGRRPSNAKANNKNRSVTFGSALPARGSSALRAAPVERVAEPFVERHD